MTTARWCDDDGKAVSPDFDTRQAAEDWMGDEWQRLLESGIPAATLMDGDKRVYRMKLTAD